MSARDLIKSFQYALQGIVHTLSTQRNMRIHFVIALIVMLLSLILGVGRWEALLLFVAITLVIVAELFNTAIEAMVDMATDTYHPLAKIAKDVAAGAVFLAAGLAIAIGATVFLPYLHDLAEPELIEEFFNPDVGAVLVLGMVLFATVFFKAFARSQKWRTSPSLTTSLAVSIVILVWGMTFNLVVSSLVTLLCLLLAGSRLRMQGTWLPVIWGAAIGSIVTVAGSLLI